MSGVSREVDGLDVEAFVRNTTETKARCRIVTQRIKESALAYFNKIRKNDRLWK